MIYPFCTSDDIKAINQQRTYDSESKPTLTQVKKFMLEISDQIRGIANAAGYDIDNFHQYNSTVALAVTAGDAIDVILSDATNFTIGDLVKIQGTNLGLRFYEFSEITNKSSNTLTLDIADNYDAGANFFVINGALNQLRNINAVGAAWMAEEATFMGVTPNRSEHAEVLRELYFGNEENKSGLWAIENIPGCLIGATVTSEAIEIRSQINSYGIQNEDDIDPRITMETDF